MYNYRAVLVIHTETSFTDSGQINFVIKQHILVGPKL